MQVAAMSGRAVNAAAKRASLPASPVGSPPRASTSAPAAVASRAGVAGGQARTAPGGPARRELGASWAGARGRAVCQRRTAGSVRPRASEEEEGAYVGFGTTRKDVILLGVGLIAGGYGLFYGLQFLGLDPIAAGNAVQITFVFLLSVGYLSTYLFRVATKKMTYTQQLKDYEDAVMEKRLEEMTDAEVQDIIEQGQKRKERQP